MKMDLLPEEELEFPLLDDCRSNKLKNRIRSSCRVIGIFALIALLIFLVTVFILDGIEIHEHKFVSYNLDVQLNTLIVCPTIKDSVIWDLKLDVINAYNDTTLHIFGGYEVSIFPYNKTKLLAKVLVSPFVNPMYIEPRNLRTYVEPGNNISVFGLVEGASVQDLNEYVDPTSGTIRFDVKIHGDAYEKELVCGDAKVALSSNSSSSSLSCGSMVGDPFTCSYEPHGDSTSSSFGDYLFLVVVGLLYVFGVLFFLNLLVGCK